MSIQEWLKKTTLDLEKYGIGTARLDALVLLEDATGKERSWLLAHQEDELASKLLSELASKIKRRMKQEPLSYIRGKTEFYGRGFIINKDVLEPRPESETMIDLLKQIVHRQMTNDKRQMTIVDVGTGSGALAITAKLEHPELEIIGTDIDPKCLVIARQNAQKHSVKIDFLQGDLLEPILSTNSYLLSTIFLANLPYVPNDYALNDAAMNEPKIAIFGGKDGLDLYYKMFKQVSTLKNKPAFIFTESLPFQHAELAKIAKLNGFSQSEESDFIQVFIPKQ